MMLRNAYKYLMGSTPYMQKLSYSKQGKHFYYNILLATRDYTQASRVINKGPCCGFSIPVVSWLYLGDSRSVSVPTPTS